MGGNSNKNWTKWKMKYLHSCTSVHTIHINLMNLPFDFVKTKHSDNNTDYFAGIMFLSILKKKLYCSFFYPFESFGSCRTSRKRHNEASSKIKIKILSVKTVHHLIILISAAGSSDVRKKKFSHNSINTLFRWIMRSTFRADESKEQLYLLCM